jgi:hypothetical protein
MISAKSYKIEDTLNVRILLGYSKPSKCLNHVKILGSTLFDVLISRETFEGIIGLNRAWLLKFI